jgi:DNA polymerase I
VIRSDAADAASALRPRPAREERGADRVRALLKRLVEAGARVRLAGADLEVLGIARLDQQDREQIAELGPEIIAVLSPEDAGRSSIILRDLGVRPVLVDDPERAASIVSDLGRTVGFDIETTAPEERPAIALTRQGRMAANQPPASSDGLDPLRARMRLAQVYDGRGRAFVFDLHRVPFETLAPLWEGRLVVHNALFELGFLMVAGIEPHRVACTMQMAGLLLGTGKGCRTLAHAAEQYLGIEDLPKGLQISDWGAKHLSSDQVAYAALDAVLALHLARAMGPELGDAEPAYRAQMAALAPTARMRLAGMPFDADLHLAAVKGWEFDLTDARRAFAQAVGRAVPDKPAAEEAFLRDVLPEHILASWPTTETGRLSLRTGDLARAVAEAPPVRHLLEVRRLEKRVRDFGRALLDHVHPATQRIHGDFMPAAAKSGRFSCREPNLQQLPPEARVAFRAPPGRRLVVADYSQMELRAAAELAADPAMRAAFQAGADLHRLTAAAIAGVDPEEVTKAQRQAAKPVNFGAVFGQGPKGLVQTAWDSYGLVLSLADAWRARDAFFRRYPALKAWMERQADKAKATQVVRTVLGRPLRAAWENGGLRYTQAVNIPVQGSCADVLLIALAEADQGLSDLDAGVIATVHDEIVAEVSDDDAAEATRRLQAAMVEAFLEVFPEAPVTDLVHVALLDCWAEAKG